MIQAQLNGGTGTIYHAMDELDVENIMKHPMTMIGSGERHNQLGEGHSHPRAQGTFPRVLELYSRDKGLFPLQTAIYKMTGLSALSFGLNNRGILKPRNKVDITLINPEKVIDQSTYLDPHQYPKGKEYVIVNGIPVVESPATTGKTPGRVIRKTEN